jgi:hypothetical protein
MSVNFVIGPTQRATVNELERPREFPGLPQPAQMNFRVWNPAILQVAVV